MGGTMKRMLALAWIGAGWMAAQSCAHAPVVEQVEQPSGEVRPGEGQSAVVLYRGVGDAKAGPVAVQVDGVPVGKLAREKFAVIDLAPGKHVISARTEFGETGLVIEAQAAAVHFVALEGSAVPKLSMRDPEVARVEIATDCTFGFRQKAEAGRTAAAAGDGHRT